MELESLTSEELNVMYGPLCWQRCDNDQGGFKKLMWYEIMKEINCKVTSTWSSCDREREMAFTHRQSVQDGDGRTTQLDYITGRNSTSEEAFLHNDVKTWDTWDHCPIYASIREDDARNSSPQRKEMWD